MSAAAQIICRSDDAGEVVDPIRAWQGVPPLRGLQHLIFLVHGYNDTIEEATEAYEGFEELQAELVSVGLDWKFGAKVVQVFWPGDAPWGLARPAYYPWALPQADQTAIVLAEIVKDLCRYAPGYLILDLVSHSMGNRVTLEMVALLDGASGLHIRRSIHMAAAVPTHRLETPGDALAHGIAAEVTSGEITSFFSSGDDVLAYAFPVGESAAFPHEGILPVALGHCEWIPNTPLPALRQRDASPSQHSHYWTGKDVQREVHNALDLSVAGLRWLPERVIHARSLAGERTLETRVVEERQAGTTPLSA